LRSLGLAARYVSGYLETLPPPGQPKLRGADASHAWYALYLPPETDLYDPEMGVRDNQPGGPTGQADAGDQPTGSWVDYDPTNDCLLGEQHITTAVGRDYRDVMPVHGIFYGGGDHQLSVAVDVDRMP
jgi:transglutaminase-like putative cysteine protease